MPRILPILVSLLFLCGCVTSPKAGAYKTLNSVATIVDTAMKKYAVAYKAGTIPPEIHAKVTEIHDKKFNPALEAAVIAARFDYNTAPPEQVSALATELINLIATVLAPKTP